MSNKWVRSVSFNKKNEKDIERLKLIGKKSFSKYIKELLDAELKRKTVTPPTTTKTATPQQQPPKKPVTTTKTVTPQVKVFNPMLRGRQ